ncbi:MAG: serine hydrolase domain-containing protein [Anaerolineae bacterium]
MSVPAARARTGGAAAIARLSFLVVALTAFTALATPRGVAGDPGFRGSEAAARSGEYDASDTRDGANRIDRVPSPSDVAGLMASLDHAAQDDPAAVVAQCMQAEMQRDGVPGGAVAVSLDGEIVYAAGFGVKHRDEGGAVDADTQFRIGSTTKTFTAAAVMRLVDQGRVDLDAPITRYITDFEMADPGAADSITLRYLLNHTSSFPDNSALSEEDLYGPTDPGALRRWVAAQSTTRLHAWPGAFHNYTSSGYMLAGHVIERVSGLSYQEYMRREVFDRAGLDDSTLLTTEVRERGNWAYGHWHDVFHGGQLTIFPIDGHDNWARHPTGYVHSTVKDLVTWADLLMTGGGDVISAESAALMQEPQVFRYEGTYQHYGFGVISDKYRSLDVKHHAGSQWGWTTAFVWVPDRRFAVATLSNYDRSLTDAAYCAVEAYLHPSDGPPVACDQERDEWREYAGDYVGRDNRGRTMDEEVVWGGDGLSMTIAYESGTVVTTPLTQTCNDYRNYSPSSFWVDTNGDGSQDQVVTFIDDSREPGVMWLRNRFFVGRRDATGRTATPGTPATPGTVTATPGTAGTPWTATATRTSATATATTTPPTSATPATPGTPGTPAPSVVHLPLAAR